MKHNLEFCKYIFEFFNLTKCSNIFNDQDGYYYSKDTISSNSTTASTFMYYVDLCYRIESNFIYIYWLINLFSPLLKFILVLFLLPFIIVIFIYSTSLFLYLKKHWLSLKVCRCLLTNNILLA